MIYRNPLGLAQHSSSLEDKNCVAAPDSIETLNAHFLTSHRQGKEIIMQRNIMVEEPSVGYSHTSLAAQDALYTASSHPPNYAHYPQHLSGSCHHDSSSPVNRAWPTFATVHPSQWHHDPQARPYESSSASAAITFRPPPGGQGTINYVNVPNVDDCVPFESYFPTDQPHGLGVLTPDQSPLAVASTVPGDQDYVSSPPPKAESPVENGGDDHSSLVQKMLVSSTPVMRSDGLKKKNAKFDIPKHRTIETIDTLINKEKDENVIKELKAQKRLLKNREAALQSRQRKKQRADDLEKQVVTLKEQLRRGSGHGEQLPRLNNGAAPRGQSDPMGKEIGTLRQHNQELSADKNELMHAMASHHKELAELRTENERLLAQLHLKSDTSESASFASSDYSDVVEHLDGIHFNGNMEYADFSTSGNTTAPRDGIAAGKPVMSHIPPQLLATLLLYGAHIASSTDDQITDRRSLPVLSPDDRAASKEMLDTLFDHANQVDRTQRLTSNVWRKTANLAELARAYPRIVADLKSMFEAPINSQNAFLGPYNN